jgi:hypothetical protein
MTRRGTVRIGHHHLLRSQRLIVAVVASLAYLSFYPVRGPSTEGKVRPLNDVRWLVEEADSWVVHSAHEGETPIYLGRLRSSD